MSPIPHVAVSAVISIFYASAASNRHWEALCGSVMRSAVRCPSTYISHDAISPYLGPRHTDRHCRPTSAKRMADKPRHSFGWCRLSVILVGRRIDRHVGPHCRHVRPCGAALSRRILLKLGTNIHHVRCHCWTGFQNQKSTAKVKAMPNALFRLRDTHRITACRLLSVRRRHRSTVWQRVRCCS